MKNAQKPEKIHLGKLIEEVKRGKFVVPDFQREFDWKPWDVRDLIKSIFMDYYIGTLLLWRGSKANYEKLSCNNLFAFEGDSNPEFIVLDGQQRLTAMHYAFFQPEENFRQRKNPIVYWIALMELKNENYDEAFHYHSKTKYYAEIVDNPERQYEENFFPLGIMQEGSWGIDDWIKGYKDFWETELKDFEKSLLDVSEEEEYDENDYEDDDESNEEYIERIKSYISFAYELRGIFKDLLDSYQVSYIELDKDIEVGKVCDIFTHINSKGVKLDTFDLLNAITRPKDIFLKQMYRSASEKLKDKEYPGFEIKSYILMVMSMLEQNYCSPKYLYYLVPGEIKKIKNKEGKIEEITLIESAQEFKDLWNVAVIAVENGLKSLKNPRDFGAINSSFLPYPSVIPALSAIKYYVKTSNLPNKVDIQEKIRKWYWSSVFLQRYSSAVESTSTRDLIELKKWFEDDEKEPEMISDFYREYKNLEFKKETRNASALYKAIFNLFILNGARDWETFDLPEYDSLDDHHIVPKSWGKGNDLGNTINTILNRAPLSPLTNRAIISNKLPNEYMKTMLEKNNKDSVMKVFKSHLISEKAVQILLRKPFTTDDYEDFLTERKSTIVSAIEKLIIKDNIEIPEDLREINQEIEEIELNLRNLIIEKLNIQVADDLKTSIPSHVHSKIKGRIERERKKNPMLVEENIEKVSFWMQFSDLQELSDIISSKLCWSHFQHLFGSKEKLASEFNDVANLRNCIRHSREIDKITLKKGEASILWFQQQLK